MKRLEKLECITITKLTELFKFAGDNGIEIPTELIEKARNVPNDLGFDVDPVCNGDGRYNRTALNVILDIENFIYYKIISDIRSKDPV